MSTRDHSENGNSIHERPVFKRALFAQCWEDPRMDLEGLDPEPGHVVVSVTSGGCNTLSLATREPEKIYAVDLNPVQSWLLALKIAGIRSLEHGEYLELLGVRPSRRRAELYALSRDALYPAAADYWDARTADLGAGVLNVGRYERYLTAFRGLLRLIHGRRRIERLVGMSSLEKQRRFYDEEWDSRLWRAFFRVFFSRTVLGMGGLDPAFFTYVKGIGSFGDHFREQARHVLVDLPVTDNYFVAQICLGRYVNERSVPPYLLAENYPRLRRAVSRIQIVTDEMGSFLKSLPADSVDRFNFSNIFEWVPEAGFREMLQEAFRVSRPGGRLCYRNLLVRRRLPASLQPSLQVDRALSERLLSEDRSFVYSHFEVVRVRKPGPEGG
jgi:S-adenosylmethionine-diacylglycerol 3-amino-3-carboxypropyl transferase